MPPSRACVAAWVGPCACVSPLFHYRRHTPVPPVRNTIVVGAPQRSTITIRNIGCVYMFQSLDNGTTWPLYQTLNPVDDLSPNRMFGVSLSVFFNFTTSIGRVVVGAPGAAAVNGTVLAAGCAYLYRINITTSAVALEVRVEAACSEALPHLSGHSLRRACVFAASSVSVAVAPRRSDRVRDWRGTGLRRRGAG